MEDRVKALRQALEDIRDMQWLWHGGIVGYTKEELHRHIQDMKDVACTALNEDEKKGN